MSEKASSMHEATSQALPAASAHLGAPGSAFRWLLPIVLCAGALALALLAIVLVPMGHAVNAEPDPVIKAVLADSFFLLQIRMWTILLTAVLIGGALAVAGSRQNSKALLRLELRLRRIADGEIELPPTDPAKDFAQFDEVFAALRSALQRASRRHLAVLQKANHSLRTLSQQLAAGKAAPDEFRKSLSDVLRELDIALDAERRSSSARARSEQGARG